MVTNANEIRLSLQLQQPYTVVEMINKFSWPEDRRGAKECLSEARFIPGDGIMASLLPVCAMLHRWAVKLLLALAFVSAAEVKLVLGLWGGDLGKQLLAEACSVGLV